MRTMMSGDALVTDEYWAITGDTGQGTLMTFSPDPRKNEAAAPVVAEFEAAGYDPEGYTLYTYAAIQVWAQAVEKAGSTDLEAVIEQLNGNQFDTVLGPIAFDDKGDVKGAAYVMYEWDNGEYVEKGRLSLRRSTDHPAGTGPQGPVPFWAGARQLLDRHPRIGCGAPIRYVLGRAKAAWSTEAVRAGSHGDHQPDRRLSG